MHLHCDLDISDENAQRGGKRTTKQQVKKRGEPGFLWKAVQVWDGNAPQPQSSYTVALDLPYMSDYLSDTRPFVYTFIFHLHAGILKEA